MSDIVSMLRRPVFLDAPCFTGAGGGLRHNDTALCAIAILEARL